MNLWRSDFEAFWKNSECPYGEMATIHVETEPFNISLEIEYEDIHSNAFISTNYRIDLDVTEYPVHAIYG